MVFLSFRTSLFSSKEAAKATEGRRNFTKIVVVTTDDDRVQSTLSYSSLAKPNIENNNKAQEAQKIMNWMSNVELLIGCGGKSC